MILERKVVCTIDTLEIIPTNYTMKPKSKNLLCACTLSAFALSAPNASAASIFTDSFGDGTLGNTIDINTNIPARQTGTTTTYTMSGANNVAHVSNSDGVTTSNNMARLRNNEQVPSGGSNGFLSADTNYSMLAGTNYSFSFDLLYNKRLTGSTDQWVSFSLGDTAGQAGPNNTASDFGMLLRPDGVGNANDQLARFYSDNVFSTGKDFTTTPSFDSSYVTFLINVNETAIGGPTVSVTAGATSILSDFAIDFEGTDRYFSFGTHLGSNAAVTATDFSDLYIDNLSITSIPEPSAVLLGCFGMLALLRRRR
ncbi:MAG: PEP-CTERM sorting domain-containing protein [Akkermansiaceae bacterium]|jgi:hypothetical protein|nr:PEP-CTERM sorting domain-containing protein [Akkermansiaceae bacterium]MDP4780219.1 PEP-CTERM sorting domain-containing protein [Akkermansiaceae bacterium]MDP4847532.1 PEP-CTERM sorting domain-containing protein [Akkermansiaceae bacterium]MDP4898005.1 PEP-CTERM sorting domain-containing protein [Akkermansiaceae bacterium]